MRTFMSFNERVCLVTGAGSASGIGYAAARILSAQGARLALVSTTERIHQRAAEIKSEGGHAKGYVADLMDRKQVEKVIKDILSDFGRIDVLVNNAGMAQVGQEEDFTEFCDLSYDSWDDSINRNLTLCFNVTRAVLPHMVKNCYGRIVNVSSVTGPVVSNPGEAAYSAAKAAVVGMSRSIAIEAAKYDVNINNVLPGWIATASQTESEAAGGLNTPAGRGGTPAEVANMIVFLASEEASYITGQSFIVDGGNTIQEYKGPSDLYY